jgi:hypothetical protein
VIVDDDILQKLQNLICPDCGDRLLRGPRGGASQNLTCRRCAMKWVAHGFVTGKVLAADCAGRDAAQAAYYDPLYPVRNCDYCDKEYRGPAVYCCLACALADA